MAPPEDRPKTLTKQPSSNTYWNWVKKQQESFSDSIRSIGANTSTYWDMENSQDITEMVNKMDKNIETEEQKGGAGE